MLCDKFYLGNTQQFYKKRMEQHFGDVANRVVSKTISDSYAAHFATHFDRDNPPKPKDIRAISKFEVIWEGNPISANKTLGKMCCQLCARERLEILKISRSNKKSKLINCSELHGACRHNPKIHRYKEELNKTNGTDERP